MRFVQEVSRVQPLCVREVDVAVWTTFPLVEAVDVQPFPAIEALETPFVVFLPFEVDIIFLEASFAFFAAFGRANLAQYSSWKVFVFEEALPFPDLLPAQPAFETVGMPSLSFDCHGRSFDGPFAVLAI